MMSKKRVRISEDIQEAAKHIKKLASSDDASVAPKSKKMHSLDSDEEDFDEDASKTLKDKDIEGQEEGDEDFEGETTITPFNMKDEMEEGHFDKDGFYRFNKEDQIKDPWMEDIDWAKVKQSENKYGSDDSSDEDGDELPEEGPLVIYKEILPYLKPNETVTRALKRLGGGKKLSSTQKWKMQKLQKQKQDTGSSDDMRDLLRLTELANKVLEKGNMDIYCETYEIIAAKLKEKERLDNPMDMFSGSIDTSNKEDAEATSVDEVQWLLRWENSDSATTEGPFSSGDMLKRQQKGEFEDKGAYVRKTDVDTWYKTSRIDFDLYV